MLEANGVGLRYPDGTLALQNVNFKIEAGELVYITGPSGSGKTSLLKLLMGAEFPTEGTLRILGQLVEKGHPHELRKLRRQIGPVFQEFRLVPGRTALENVMLGMRFLDIPHGKLKDNSLNALERVGLSAKIRSRVENLSWGERQRVSIARAVARKPALILADEPTGNLDRENALKIFQLLNSFKDNNTAVVITTHATHLMDPDLDGLHIRVSGGEIFCEGLVRA